MASLDEIYNFFFFFFKKTCGKGAVEGSKTDCSVQLVSHRYYLLDIISKPSQKSRTFTSEIMAQFLQFTKSTSWSPNSRLKASGFQSSDFNFLWTPDTSTGWEYKDACLLHCNQISYTCSQTFFRAETPDYYFIKDTTNLFSPMSVFCSSNIQPESEQASVPGNVQLP